MHTKAMHSFRSQRGTALVIVLLILVAATLLSINAVTQGTLQAKMASASEAAIKALQGADSAVDYVIDKFSDYEDEIGVDSSLTVNNTGSRNDIEIKPAIALQSADGETLVVNISKLAAGSKECVKFPRVRIDSEGKVGGSRGRLNNYIIDADLDRSNTGNGSAHVYRGYTVINYIGDTVFDPKCN
jgi:Tfp pilus assembly protein PilX